MAHSCQNISPVPGTANPPRYAASLSTMWARRFPDFVTFFQEAGALGFAQVELNHQVDSEMLSGVDISGYRISSVHEPCPADIPVDELKERDWLVSAIDEDNRRKGVQAVRRSVNLAHQINAGLVVVHSGNMAYDSGQEKKLRALFKAGKTSSDEYQAVRQSMHLERAQQAERHMKSVKQSLLELLEYSSQYGILLGLENRYHYFDIPVPDEMEQLLELAGPDQLGFVYDSGHAQTLDRLGFFNHESWLKRFSQRILATHLHDVIGTVDHYAPGLGDVDFHMVASYLPSDALRTCEIKWTNTAEEIKNGLEYLIDSGCIPNPEEVVVK